MYVRLLMIGAAALAASGVATAQSAPANAQGNAQQGGTTTADLVVAASAATDVDMDEEAEAKETASTSAPSRPRRAARVTTCRCGDPNQ